MVNMTKRSADYDSDDDQISSSDEDNGNFKRRRRHHSSGDDSKTDEDFVTKTLQSFNTSEVSKPLKVLDNRVDTQKEKQLIQKQRQLNEKLSKLPKYDDLFDNSAEDCLQSNAINTSSVTNEAKPKDVPKERKTTTIEVADDEVDSLAGGDTKQVSKPEPKPKTNDPRLRRLERFSEPETEATPLVAAISGQALVKKVSDLLNARKPLEAYTALKADVQPLQLHKYQDLLLVMAKDWFPSLIDNAFDPRAVWIELSLLIRFSDLMRDVFATKVKSKEFWESVITSIEKFIEESRIREILTCITKLRWILVKDIRHYLITEDVKISTKVSAILLDHKIKLDSKRAQHRRDIEKSAQLLPPPRAVQPLAPPPQTQIPIIIGCPSVPQKPKPSDPFNDEMINPFVSTSIPMPFASNAPNEKRNINQVLECLTNEQYYKLVQMLDRHTRTDHAFIEHIGQALRLFVERNPKYSVFTVYQKLHDTFRLNLVDFNTTGKDDKRLETIFEKLLKQFHATVMYNPKEWIQIRDHTRTEKFREHFKVENPFNEKFVAIKHNIIIDCGYFSEGLVINYTAIEEDIPLMAQNVILKDPRIELRAELLVDCPEVILLDEPVVGMFSPNSSSPDSPSSSPPDNMSSPSDEEIPPKEMAESVILEEPRIELMAEPIVNTQEVIKSDIKDTNNKRIIKLSKTPYNMSELKSIRRRVSLSSDSSDDSE